MDAELKERLEELVCLYARYGGYDYQKGLADFIAEHWPAIKAALAEGRVE